MGLVAFLVYLKVYAIKTLGVPDDVAKGEKANDSKINN